MANTTDTRLEDLPVDFVTFNQGPVAERVAAAMMGLSGGFVLLRLAARATRKARLGLDDWIILAALWTFISEIMYGATMTSVKLSILAMYDRLFPTKFMRRAVVSLAAVAMLWYLAVILVALLIVIDIIILSLPIREVRRLQIVNWQKAAVCGMFLLGGFVSLVSIIRLKFVAEMVNVDPRADGTMVVSTAIWSAVEVGIAIMCACLPTLQPLIRMASAYIARKTQHSSSISTNNAPGRGAYPPGGSDSRGSRGWTRDSSRPLNHAESNWSFKYAQDDLELGRLSREHPAFRNSFPMGLNIMPSAAAARTGRRSAGPLSLGPVRAERPLSLGLQGILRKSLSATAATVSRQAPLYPPSKVCILLSVDLDCRAQVRLETGQIAEEAQEASLQFLELAPDLVRPAIDPRGALLGIIVDGPHRRRRGLVRVPGPEGLVRGADGLLLVRQQGLGRLDLAQQRAPPPASSSSLPFPRFRCWFLLATPHHPHAEAGRRHLAQEALEPRPVRGPDERAAGPQQGPPPQGAQVREEVPVDFEGTGSLWTRRR
ncbi:uncharacterized protein PG986_007678 [Apiospora aurea]|uniref:Rhodopsin domain-containing protein n=1 Tax=Apiospora aurea TaxID=335848 RepID=A0ABR1QDB1_9PEZI